jgi:RNA polymerase-associated protein RTF1
MVQKEYERLVKVCKAEDVKLPTKQALERKVADMKRLIDQPMTEVGKPLIYDPVITKLPVG